MRINTNISSLAAQRYLQKTQKALTRALERLASGRRINRAGDDAAGLAISEGLRAQSRGIWMGIKNLNEATGYLNSRDGVLAGQLELVHRMRELAVQSANGILSLADRQNLNVEFQSLLAEVDRISETNPFEDDVQLQIGPQRESVVTMDLPSSRSADLFTENYWLESFSASARLNGGGGISGLVSEDLDGDGDKDLVQSVGTQVQVFLNDGQGRFSQIQTISPGSNTVTRGSLALEDFNGDGVLDLAQSVAGAQQLIIRYGNGDGTFGSGITTSNFGGTYQMEFADFNSDGRLDLVNAIGGSGQIGIRIGSSDGTFSFSSTIALGTNMQGIKTGDFNSDGNMDLFASDAASVHYVLMGDGEGNFSLAQTMVGFALDMVIDDFDDDGDLDMFGVGYQGVGSIYLNDGAGNFSIASTISTLASPAHIGRAVRAGDFNHDGISDVAVVGAGVAGVVYHLGRGDGSFAGPQTVSTSGTRSQLVVADFNGDGWDDFASGSQDSTSTTDVHFADIGERYPVEMNITSQESAANILDILDRAQISLLRSRATVGAQLSRLESTYQAQYISAQALEEARSQIIDTEFAQEVAELTRQQVLQQAGASVLAQANVQMSLVLQLLRF